jgi:hypothetical protein
MRSGQNVGVAERCVKYALVPIGATLDQAVLCASDVEARALRREMGADGDGLEVRAVEMKRGPVFRRGGWVKGGGWVVAGELP